MGCRAPVILGLLWMFWGVYSFRCPSAVRTVYKVAVFRARLLDPWVLCLVTVTHRCGGLVKRTSYEARWLPLRLACVGIGAPLRKKPPSLLVPPGWPSVQQPTVESGNSKICNLLAFCLGRGGTVSICRTPPQKKLWSGLAACLPLEFFCFRGRKGAPVATIFWHQDQFKAVMLAHQY